MLAPWTAPRNLEQPNRARTLRHRGSLAPGLKETPYSPTLAPGPNLGPGTQKTGLKEAGGLKDTDQMTRGRAEPPGMSQSQCPMQPACCGLSRPHSSVVPQNLLEQSQTPYGACQALLTWTAWHTPPSPHRAMLILPPPRPRAEGLLPSLRGPLTLPRHPASLSLSPCHLFQGTRKVLQHFLDKLNPGLCMWLAKHPAQHLRTLTCMATPGPGVKEARPLSYVQEAARMGGPAAQGAGPWAARW